MSIKKLMCILELLKKVNWVHKYLVHYYGQLIDITILFVQMEDVEDKNASNEIKKTGRCLYIKDIWTVP